MGSSQDSLGSWDERLQLATAMSEVTEADSSVLHEVHERMLDSQREEVQRRRSGGAGWSGSGGGPQRRGA